MRTDAEKKQKAIKLRKQGCSYSEIREEVDVPKSTLSGWVSNINLTKKQLKRLKNKMKEGRDRARYKAIKAHRKKRKKREEKAKEKARETFAEYMNDPLFAVGLALYWAEGAKKNHCASFMNSDPEMCQVMMCWFQRFLDVKKSDIRLRLYIHEPYKDENCEKHWADILNVPLSQFKDTVYKPTPHSVKKNLDYKGCLRLSVKGIQRLRQIKAWRELFVDRLNKG